MRLNLRRNIFGNTTTNMETKIGNREKKSDCLWEKLEAEIGKDHSEYEKTGEAKYLTKMWHDYYKLCYENDEQPLSLNKIEWEWRKQKYEPILKHLDNLRDELKCKWVFITINLPNTDDILGKLQKNIEKLKHRRWWSDSIEGGYYVYEQRSNIDEETHGEHIHILLRAIKSNKPKSEYIRETAKSIECEENSIDVVMKNRHDAQIALNYILGDKGTEEKRAKQKKDKLWRIEKGLKPFYKISGRKTSPLSLPEC